MNQDNLLNSQVQDEDDLAQKRMYPFDQANHSGGEPDAGLENIQCSQPKKPCPNPEENMELEADASSGAEDLEEPDELPVVEVVTHYTASRYFPGTRRLDNQGIKRERKYVLGLPHYMFQPDDAVYLMNNYPKSNAFMLEDPIRKDLLPSEMLNPGITIDNQASITEMVNREIRTAMMFEMSVDNDNV